MKNNTPTTDTERVGQSCCLTKKEESKMNEAKENGYG
jgi:hypothetical protein